MLCYCRIVHLLRGVKVTIGLNEDLLNAVCKVT